MVIGDNEVSKDGCNARTLEREWAGIDNTKDADTFNSVSVIRRWLVVACMEWRKVAVALLLFCLCYCTSDPVGTEGQIATRALCEDRHAVEYRLAVGLGDLKAWSGMRSGRAHL